MVSYLQIENLTKSYGDCLLFSDVTMGVFQGDRIGLIAENGAGKTTFLKIITGIESPDSGNVVFKNDLRTGYLPQEIEFEEADTVESYLRKRTGEGNDELFKKAEKFLTRLKISGLDQKMSEMSGGQTKRVALAFLLAEEPDLLILDEPTNHLDISVVEWLESYLSRQNMTLIMVTHDRYFLDKVCNKIIEIEDQQVYTYSGNYDYYLEKREERKETRNAELLKVRNILRKELEWVRRQPQARGTKAKCRLDNFEKLKQQASQRMKDREFALGKGATYIGSKIFEAKNVTKSFGETRILDNWNYVFSRYEKVGIIGENGAGKTTFIKLLLGEETPDSGYFDIGETVKWGYYSQEGIIIRDENKKVIDAVNEIAENVRIDEKTVISSSQFLSRFLFTPAKQQDYIHKLSGGEKRRLNLALVLMKNPNFLILDEPTNDLDILTLSILEDYLSKFKGCLIIVSHDRFFLDKTVDHLFVFKGNAEVDDFPGNYSQYRDYMDALKAEQAEKKPVDSKSKPSKPEESRQRRQGLTYKEKRELEELNQLLENLEERKRLNEEILNSGISDHEKLMAASSEIKEIIEKIDETEMRLLELMEKEG